MTLTAIDKDFLDTISTIGDDDDFLLGMLHLANNDDLKRKIIDKIKEGKLKTRSEIIKTIID